VTIRTTFAACGSLASAALSQREHSGRLVWALSVRCDAHDEHLAEIDGWGLPPADVRDQVLADDGTFCLVVRRDEDTVRALRTLQKGLDLDLATISRIRSAIPGAVLCGTRDEVRWLMEKLRSQNIDAQSEPLVSGSATMVPDLSELVSPQWTGRPRP
jgi:hypothetical protein